MFVYENLRGRYNDDYRDEEDYLSRPLRADLRRLSCLITTLSSPLSHVEKGFDPAATRATMRDLSWAWRRYLIPLQPEPMRDLIPTEVDRIWHVRDSIPFQWIGYGAFEDSIPFMERIYAWLKLTRFDPRSVIRSYVVSLWLLGFVTMFYSLFFCLCMR